MVKQWEIEAIVYEYLQRNGFTAAAGAFEQSSKNLAGNTSSPFFATAMNGLLETGTLEVRLENSEIREAKELIKRRSSGEHRKSRKRRRKDPPAGSPTVPPPSGRLTPAGTTKNSWTGYTPHPSSTPHNSNTSHTGNTSQYQTPTATKGYSTNSTFQHPTPPAAAGYTGTPHQAPTSTPYQVPSFAYNNQSDNKPAQPFQQQSNAGPTPSFQQQSNPPTQTFTQQLYQHSPAHQQDYLNAPPGPSSQQAPLYPPNNNTSLVNNNDYNPSGLLTPTKQQTSRSPDRRGKRKCNTPRKAQSLLSGDDFVQSLTANINSKVVPRFWGWGIESDK
eukprot:sb/3466642/